MIPDLTLTEALTEINRLRDDLAEALATLANERGEGEPPCEGWRAYQSSRDDGSSRGEPRLEWGSDHGIVVRTLTGWHWRAGAHADQVYHRGEYVRSGTAPTARSAIRAATAAEGGAA